MAITSWVNSIVDAGREIMRGDRKLFGADSSGAADIGALCEQLLSSKGEALGTALTCSLVDICKQLDSQEKLDFFGYLAA